MTLPAELVAAILQDPLLPAQFDALCDCGGRLAGTASEQAALDLTRGWGADAARCDAVVVPTAYAGWRATDAALTLIAEGRQTPLPCLPLLRSAASGPAGMEAEVVSVGRGTPEEFAALGPALRGRIALVRHEYMFAAGHIHRRRKYMAALEGGAVGFLIAGPLPAAVVAGSSGRGNEPGIPALGLSPESAARLAGVRARIWLMTHEVDAVTETQLFDLPGASPGWVVLSAHIDGHTPAESAMDNATGVAVALAVTRALAPYRDRFARGLRLALFSAEEWGLTGSRQYLAGLSGDERALIALNINLDSVGGDGRLTALCSEFPALAAFVMRSCSAAGLPVRTYLPRMDNSDHANFAAHGIPALRLVAGFDDPHSNLRHVLTAADTRDKVAGIELRTAALVSAALTWDALTAEATMLAGLRNLTVGG